MNGPMYTQDQYGSAARPIFGRGAVDDRIESAAPGESGLR